MLFVSVFHISKKYFFSKLFKSGNIHFLSLSVQCREGNDNIEIPLNWQHNCTDHTPLKLCGNMISQTFRIFFPFFQCSGILNTDTGTMYELANISQQTFLKSFSSIIQTSNDLNKYKTNGFTLKKYGYQKIFRLKFSY